MILKEKFNEINQINMKDIRFSTYCVSMFAVKKCTKT